jgi:hypothetical protein
MEYHTIRFTASLAGLCLLITIARRYAPRLKRQPRYRAPHNDNWPPITRMAVALAMLTLVGCSGGDTPSDQWSLMILIVIIITIASLLAARLGYERGRKAGWEDAVQRMHDLEEEDES